MRTFTGTPSRRTAIALPDFTSAPTLTGYEGYTQIAPGIFAPLPGLDAAPAQPFGIPGLTAAGPMPALPGFGAVDPAFSGSQISQSVPGPFVSSDPLVGDLANMIEAALPGRVLGVNVPFLRQDGSTITDADIMLTDGTVIQVKSGTGAKTTRQMKVTAAKTGGRVIAYGPALGGSLERSLKTLGFELYRSPQALINALRGNP